MRSDFLTIQVGGVHDGRKLLLDMRQQPEANRSVKESSKEPKEALNAT
jgi:hypothetical protein